ncbi:hypothetical protein HPG69_000846 [Diceros bicornis minor]|uniref:Uncharacterized protein n=1 Tax=Diceros bicornis minor TaxID=77932 RepID=A0A7J7FGF9_DICBM|nr:hypothetical protein HPG69_000846 [Diceros bicornis minor]
MGPTTYNPQQVLLLPSTPVEGRQRGHVPPSQCVVCRGGHVLHHTSWMYQLQQGNRPRIYFACFKAAFLDPRDLLESEDWEDEVWDPELMDHTEAGPEQGASPGMGPSWGQGQE